MKKLSILLVMVISMTLLAGCKTVVVTGSKSKQPEKAVTADKTSVQAVKETKEKAYSEEDVIK